MSATYITGKYTIILVLVLIFLFLNVRIENSIEEMDIDKAIDSAGNQFSILTVLTLEIGSLIRSYLISLTCVDDSYLISNILNF